MKILILHSELGVLRGGGENFTRNLFRAFAKRGHHVSAAFIADSGGRYPIAMPEEIHPIALPGLWSRKLGQQTLSKLGSCIPRDVALRAQWDRIQEAMCWRTVRWHDRRFTRRVEMEFSSHWKQFDAVYVHGSPMLASHVASFCTTILRLPGPVPAGYVPALKKIHAVCANGDALTKLRDSIGDHATELPIGIDISVFNPGPTPVRKRLGWTKDQWVLGYVGRLAYVKGIDLLAMAFAEIRKTIPHARLLIVGVGEEEEKLRKELSTELRDGVAHIEPDLPHDRLVDWYRAMDLFVMPSRYENFSNAALEALASGIPVLLSDVGGNSHLLDGGGGWLFDQGSRASLVRTLSHIRTSPQWGLERGLFVGNKIRGRYSWETSAKRLEDILQSCLNNNVGRTCRL